MKNTADSTRKLWQTLGLLALAIVLVIVIDSLSFPTETSSDAIADESRLSTDTTDTVPFDAETSAPPVTEKPENAVRLTMLGECSPGSPFGTTAYGSLNALIAEQGTPYFFSALHGTLASDDLTIAANSCLFADPAVLTASALCASTTESTAVYTDGSVEVVVDLLSDAPTNAALTAAGMTVADGNTQFFELGGIQIALFTTEITKDADHAELLTQISETTDSVDYVILYFFGGEENSHTVETWMRNALYTFADTGVDLLVGVGNCVLRPVEHYGNSVIAYSLGTLIDGSQLVPENATAILQIDLSKSDDGGVQADVQIFPCFVYGERWQPTLMTDPVDIDRVHRFLSGELQMPIEIAG